MIITDDPWPVRCCTHASVLSFASEVVTNVPRKSCARSFSRCWFSSKSLGRYRNKIGLDVALEAMRAYLSRRGRSIDELLEAAAVPRVAKVMQPYIEAMA